MAERTPEPTSNESSAARKRAVLGQWLRNHSESVWTAPVSYAQQRLWFLDQLEPAGSVYNVCRSLRLTGPLSIPSLEQATRALISHQQAFRTTFIQENGTPLQSIRASGPFHLEVESLESIPEQDRETELRGRLRALGQQPFDLIHGPLFRMRVFRIGPDDHVVLWVMHHIISDGTSMAVLFRDLSECYRAALEGRPAQLKSLGLTYGDFVIWQRAWFRAGGLEKDLPYWKERLTDAPPHIQLPADLPRPAVTTYKGDILAFELPESITSRIATLSRAEKVTPFIVLLAAFRALLLRYTGQEDVCIGTPIANRQRPELQQIIGFFANSLVLRTDVSHDPTFRELIQRDLETAKGAFLHQDLPFERLVEELQPVRDLSRTPLFQVMLALLDDPVPQFDLPGIQVQEWLVGNGTSKFDLFLSIEQRDGRMRGFWEYSTDLFQRSTIERLSGHFTTLLDAALNAPDLTLSQLPLLNSAEKHHLLHELNQTARAFPAGKRMPDLLEAQASKSPDSIALSFHDPAGPPGSPPVAWTYAELHRKSNQLARKLQTEGVGPETLVAACFERTPLLAVALLGILKAGGAYVPVDPKYPSQRIQFMLEDSKTTLVLTQQSLSGQLPQTLAKVWCLDDPDFQRQLATQSHSAPAPKRNNASDQDLAYLIFTSGSTGRPKAVALEHRNAVTFIHWALEVFTPAELSHVLFSTSVCFDLSIFELFVTWSAGGTVHFADHALALPSLPHRDQITLINTVPSAIAELLRLNAIPPSVRTINLAGEFLSAELVDRLYQLPHVEKVYDLYGPSEDTTYSTYTLRRQGAPPSIGRPIANTQAYVLDSQRQLVPKGVPGELYLGGDGLARGYLHRPDLTAERFVPNPFPDTPGRRLYRTGDLVRHLPDGTLEYCGRLDHQVKIRGYRIELGEIESEIRQHESIVDAVVVAREDQAGDKRVVAYVVPRETSPDTVTDQQEELQREQLNQWETVWEETYRQSREAKDPHLNLVGWISSFTGKPIPTSEMREWVDETTRRILALKPRRVLEIGCGTGLLLFRVAPHVERYRGLDVSHQVIDALKEFIQRPEHALPHVWLSQGSADSIAETTRPDEFDLVIINSVAQYFPSRDYLMSVIRSCVRCVRPGGSVFLGDLRHARWLASFHHSTQLAVAPADLTVGELRKRIQQSMLREQELAVDPALFCEWRQSIRGLGDVQVYLKDGDSDNELTRYRYDAILRVGMANELTTPLPWLDAHSLGKPLTLDEIRDRLKKVVEQGAGVLGIRRLPNQRLALDARLLEWMAESDPSIPVQALRATLQAEAITGIAPQKLYRLGRELGCTVQVRTSAFGQDDEMDVVFVHGKVADAAAWLNYPEEPGGRRNLRTFTNQPLQGVFTRRLLPNLKSALESRLPDYMIPSAFVVLDVIPRNANGKLNRKALPPPDRFRDGSTGTFQSPRTPTEEKLAQIWADLLGQEKVGVTDDFFELGGHSLLATQVISRIRQEFQIELPLRTLFEFPTIEALASKVPANAGDPKSAGTIECDPQRNRAPLSFSQQRLWFLAQYEPDSYTYIIAPLFRIRGSLNFDALQNALNTLQKRHASLRTAFLSEEGIPVQVILPERQVELTVEDLQSVPEADRISQTEARAAILRQIPFDLSKGYLFRAQVLVLSPEHTILQLCIHHTCCDGWSIGVLTQELSQAYNAAVEQRTPSFIDLPIQYADYSVWQREWIQGEVLERQMQYWRKRLENAPPFLPFPTDRPRPALQTYRGRNHEFRLPASLAHDLRSLAARSDATLFMVTLSAFYVLLSRYSGQEDLCVGTPIANRTRQETEGLVGFFVNSLVLRGDLGGNPTVLEWIGKVRKLALDAYEHQDLPLEKLVEELQPERNLSYSPLFQVLFVLQNTPSCSLDFPGCNPSPLEYPGGTAKFDLSLFLEERNDEILGILEYNPDLFDDSTLERMAGHYRRLLEQMVLLPQARIQELQLLTDVEQRQVTVDWNQTAATYRDTLCAQQCFEKQAALTPHATALTFGQESMTYAELNERANQLGHELQSLGVGPDVRVGICLERSILQPIALLGVLKAGGCYVPLDPQYPSDRIQLMLADARVKVILTHSSFAEKFTGLSDHLIGLDMWAGNNFVSHPPPPQRNPDRLAYVIFTSGSTGRPKGVAMSHRSLVNLIDWQNHTPGSLLGVGTKTLQFASLSFDVHFQELFVTWSAGGTVVMVDEHIRRDPGALLQLISESRIDRIFMPYVALQQLAEAAAFHPELSWNLQHVITAGEALHATPALRQWFSRMPGCTLENQYGPSETHVITAYRLPSDPNEWPDLPPIGHPIANAQTYVLAPNREPSPIGVPGELFLGGIPLARGYLDRPDLTQDRFIPNPFQIGQRMYRTGDLVKWRADGLLDFLGRVDEQVKIRGFRVELGEVESVLARHPEIQEAVVSAIPDGPTQKLIGYYIAKPDRTPSVDALKSFLGVHLPDYMIPQVFIPLEKLPLTPSGKVHRRALPKPRPEDLSSQRTFIAPTNELEQTIAQVWQELLRLPRVGSNDHFFELGGHSLLMVQLQSKLQQALNRSIAVVDLFRYPTVGSLARALAQTQPDSLNLNPIQERIRKQREMLARKRGKNEGKDS